MLNNHCKKLGLTITIENKKGTYKSFESASGEKKKPYPLKGVTYPVDYGCVEGYKGEDGAPLDVFSGTGDKHGYMTIWRTDVPVETKFFIGLSDTEIDQVLDVFDPVILSSFIFKDEQDFSKKIAGFKA